MANTVRVYILRNSLDDTLKLCQRIIEQHQALGAACPLTNFIDMNQLFNLTNNVCKAAKVIFVDKPETAGMFELK